jgi:lipoprotein
MKLIANIVLLSILLGCSNQYAPINSTSKSNHNEKLQEKTEAELEKESSIYPPIKDFPFEVKVIPVLYIDEEQTELTRDESYDPKTSIGGEYNILVTNKINHDIQLFGPLATELPRIADRILEIKDFNNDGFLDIKAMDLAPMGSRFLSSEIYLYNP